jgi:OmpA-OmpF porin, OOP family
MKHYSNAQARFERGRNLDSIRAELARASEYLKKATETSRLARAELAALIKTRDDAQKVNSARYASDLWARGEESFSKAVLELEHGAPDGAKERAREADRFYRDAELVSIKATYLSETRLLIARAEKEKIYKHAPKTLEKAKTLLRQADKALNDNRYDTDLPRSVAQQANYEARHAIYLAQAIERARASKQSMEDVILDWEAPIRRLLHTSTVRRHAHRGSTRTSNSCRRR